jgi:hypothetical protein
LQLEEEDARMNEERKQVEEVDLMELRLGGGRGSKSKEKDGIGGSSNSKEEEEEEEVLPVVVEKEHMFDKVVTPSDVGKLNRLVIPKQYAEKYFPLDSSNQKGLLLTFEDRDGKMWRFRYSYWNSSQSYVMTKGWSRFVKEKKLDAGDIVSFHRGRHQLYRHKLYIDWRPRSHSQHPHHLIQPHMIITGLPNFYLPNHHHSSPSSLYTSSQYSQLPNYPTNAAIHPPPYPHQYYNNNFYTTSTALHQHHHHHPPAEHLNNMNPLYYLPSSPITPTATSGGGGGVHQHLQGQGQQQDQRNVNVPMNMIIDSVPVAHHHRGGNDTNSSGKRSLRLFGVNMECESTSANSAAATTSGLFDSQYRRQQ